MGDSTKSRRRRFASVAFCGEQMEQMFAICEEGRLWYYRQSQGGCPWVEDSLLPEIEDPAGPADQPRQEDQPLPPPALDRRNQPAIDRFGEWLVREMPPGTVIGSPLHWAPRIVFAVLNACEEAELTPLPAPAGDPVVTSADAAIASILAQHEEILAAFVAKYGADPDHVEQVEQRMPDGSIRWFVRLKTTAGLEGGQ